MLEECFSAISERIECYLWIVGLVLNTWLNDIGIIDSVNIL